MPPSSPTDTLSRTFAALADPTRRQILAHLIRGEASVNELAEPFALSLQAVSKHIKVLEGAGLITRGKNAQWRPARLHGAPLGQAWHWLEPYKPFWEDSLDALDDHLRTMQTQSKIKKGKKEQ